MKTDSGCPQNQTVTVEREPARSKRRMLLIVLLTMIGACLGVLSLQPRSPRLAWNYTESVALGLYHIDQATPQKGDLLAVAPAGAVLEVLSQYKVLPSNRVLLKHLAASAGDTVCRHATSLTINGAFAATALETTKSGISLPLWEGCKQLSTDQIFLLAPHPLSFDGRYFGPTDAHQIIGVARPLLLLDDRVSS